MNNEPFVIERTYNAPSATIWKAITDKDEMKKWYFVLEAFKAEEGFEFQFWGGDDKVQYLHLCKVMEVIPGKKLSYTWRYDNIVGISLVTFELFEEGDRTKVKLTHSGIETFATDDTNFKKESFAKGWTYILGTSLKDYLEKNK